MPPTRLTKHVVDLSLYREEIINRSERTIYQLKFDVNIFNRERSSTNVLDLSFLTDYLIKTEMFNTNKHR